MDVASIELKQIERSDIQRTLHIPEVVGEKISSNFSYPYGKVGYSTPQIERFKQGASDDKKAEYIYDGKGTFIETTYIIQKFPAIKVRKQLRNKIRICMTHNLLLNTIRDIYGNADGVQFFTLPKVYLDFWIQYFRKPEFTRDTLEKIGNIEELENWTTDIRPFEANFDLPCPYSLDQALSFPKVLVDTFSIVMTINHKLADLIRMQELKEVNGEMKWVNIPVKMSYLGMKPDAKLTLPEVWGEIRHNTDIEINWLKCKESYHMWYTDIVATKSTNSEVFGNTLAVDVNSQHPAKAFLWAAENVTSSNNHLYSNYSTNSTNPSLGKNPIKHVTFDYTGGKKFDETPSIHFDSVIPRRHFRSQSLEPGYNGFSVSNNPISIAIDSGLVTSETKPKFTAMLGEDLTESIYEEDESELLDDLNIEDEESENRCKFNLHFIMIVQRRISFIQNEDTKKFKILLDNVENERT